MHQQGRRPEKIKPCRIRYESTPGLSRKGRTEQEIAIAMHNVDGRTCSDTAFESGANLCIRRLRVIIANPGFEQVSQNVQGLRVARMGFQEINESFNTGWTGRMQM